MTLSVSNTDGPPPVDPRRFVILTEGYTTPLGAKTATCVVRYRPETVVALLDSTLAGSTAEQVLGVGGSTPVVASLKEAPDANALLIGVAPSRGRIPAPWRKVILEAIDRKLDIVSGLHEFLCDDPEFAEAARRSGARLIDVRKNDEKDVALKQGLREECLRIHTVGNDCSVGKMLVALEIANGLKRRGLDSKFVATGQTGILVEGDGCPIDRVVADFVSGAAEKLVLSNQHHEVLVVEGQGTLAHPKYSGVTLGLLHGTQPHGLILCYEVGRRFVHGMEGIPLRSLEETKHIYETMANLMGPCQVIGVAMNSRNVSRREADEERDKVQQALGVPACDVVRHGPDALLDVVLQLREARAEVGI